MKAVMAEMLPHWLAERKNSEAAQWDEMWEGVLHMPPMPNRFNQRFARDLLIFLQVRWAKPRGAEVHQEVNLTTVADEEHWTLNYRIPDLVMLTKDRLSIDKNEYMAGTPLVVVEVRSPGDETDEKLPFYAALGVPEVWVFDRDMRTPEVRTLVAGTYQLRSADADGWLRSPAAGVEFRQTRPGKVWVRIGGDDASAEELPDD